MEVQRPRGTRDFLPDEIEKRRQVENILREVAEKWGYGEIKTPTFEHIELFTLKSGEGILDEIYNFKDKGDREIALRPELTAPVIRMYVEGLQRSPKPLKFYYFDNCFRYERPQKGRFREFFQFGIEIIGSARPEADAELIGLHGINAVPEARSLIGDNEAISQFETLLELLEVYELEYQVDLGIARGLDYYTGMVFEIYCEGLGAQNQVCGGGSYRLAALFGGEDTPSTGYGIGFDRIMEICEVNHEASKRNAVVSL